MWKKSLVLDNNNDNNNKNNNNNNNNNNNTTINNIDDSLAQIRSERMKIKQERSNEFLNQFQININEIIKKEKNYQNELFEIRKKQFEKLQEKEKEKELFDLNEKELFEKERILIIELENNQLLKQENIIHFTKSTKRIKRKRIEKTIRN